MRRALKVAGSAFGVLLLLAAATAAYLAATFDAARVKDELTRLVAARYQRTLRVDGDLKLSFYPRLGVALGRTTLSEPRSGTVFAALDAATVSLQVIPLLSKRLVADRIELDGLRATLIRHPDGSLNIADLLSGDKKEEGAMPRFDIAGVEITHGALTWKDEVAGNAYAIFDLALNTGRLSNAAQGGLSLSGRIETDALPGGARVELKGDYDYDLDTRRYGVKALAAGLKGKLGNDDIELALHSPQLALDKDAIAGDAELDLKLSGAARKADAKVALSGVEGNAQTVSAIKMALAFDAKSGDTSLRCTLSSPLAINLPARVVDLPKLAGNLDVAHPRMPMQHLALPVDGAVHADLKQPQANVKLNTRFDGGSVKARIDLARFSPPALRFDLDIERIDADKILPPADPSAPKPGSAEDPIDLSALKSLDLNGTVRIGALQVKNVKATRVALMLKADKGHLTLAPHTASLYGGTLSGSLVLDADGNRIVLHENIDNVAIDPLLKDLLGKAPVEGRGTVTFDVSGQGATVSAMKRSLAGKAALNLRDGAIRGINLAQALRVAKARIGGGQDAVQQASATEKTDFSELTASFTLAGGVAHNEDLNFKSPFLRLGGSGDIDLAGSRLDYLAKAVVVGSPSGQGGAELDSLKGLTVPVRISGPFDQLAYRLELGDLVREATKTRVDEARQKLKQRMEDGVRDKLRGLFGK